MRDQRVNENNTLNDSRYDLVLQFQGIDVTLNLRVAVCKNRVKKIYFKTFINLGKKELIKKKFWSYKGSKLGNFWQESWKCLSLAKIQIFENFWKLN